MPKTVTIKLSPKKGADKPKGIQSGDTIQWDNQTDRGRAIIFSIWPFIEVPETIRAPEKNTDEGYGNGRSKSYTVATLEFHRSFPYVIDPTINPDDGPPDEPSMDGDP